MLRKGVGFIGKKRADCREKSEHRHQREDPGELCILIGAERDTCHQGQFKREHGDPENGICHHINVA